MNRDTERDMIQILYAADDNFAPMLGISIMSLFETEPDAGMVVYIFESNISSENKKRIEEIFISYGRNAPVWIPAVDICERLSMKIHLDRGSVSQYARLFLSSKLPKTCERVLYLDCDILLNDSVTRLWNLDMHGKTVAALADAFSQYYRRNLGLRKDDVMFNSGVMLIDLRRWREQSVEKKLLHFIAARKGRIQQGDQGALNAVLSRDTYCFSPVYNAVTIFFDFTYEELLRYRQPVCFYSERVVKDAVEQPVIIHFTTSFLSERPWVKGCKHRYAKKWLDYKARSPWRDTPLKRRNGTKGVKGFCRKLAKHLPRSWVIWMAGVLQVYGRPLYYRVVG